MFRLSSVAFCIVHVYSFVCAFVTTLFYCYHETNAKVSIILKPAAKHLPFVMIYLTVNLGWCSGQQPVPVGIDQTSLVQLAVWQFSTKPLI